MFSLSTITSTLLISIFGLVVTFFVIYPISLHKKKKIWLSIKLCFIIIGIILIILLLDTKRDSFLFIGSFLGIGFLLKVVFGLTRFKSLNLLLSYLSFTFIFLSSGHIILFILNLGFAYILTIFLSFYKLNNHEIQNRNQKTKPTRFLKTLLPFFALLALLGSLLYDLLINQSIWFQNDSLIQLFSGQYNVLILVIFTCIFFAISIVIFTMDIQKKYSKRKDEPWYS
jgi:hypothetical protein